MSNTQLLLDRKPDFASRLEILMDKKGIHPREKTKTLCHITNTTYGAARKWRGGEAWPEMDKLVVIAEYFKCSLDWLIMGYGEIDINAPHQPEPTPTLSVDKEFIVITEEVQSVCQELGSMLPIAKILKITNILYKEFKAMKIQPTRDHIKDVIAIAS